MKDQRIKDLFILVLSDKASSLDREELLDLLIIPENEELARSMIFEAFGKVEFYTDMEADAAENIVQAIMYAENTTKTVQLKKRKNGIWVGIAASILVLCSVCLYTYLNGQDSIPSEKERFAADFTPGSDKATLILGDGSLVSLDGKRDKIIQDESGVHIRENEHTLSYQDSKDIKGKIQYNQIITPNGGQYHLSLPDGSRVWLNAATSIRFPVSFSGNMERMVELSGEAYFEVKKDKSHPFRVRTKNQQVEVLGTHFNVNGYSNEKALKTTLTEGKVKVTLMGNAISQSAFLVPGQESTLTNKKIRVEKVDTENAVSWHMGYFMFHRESLERIMNKVSRWYDVQVVYNDDKLRAISFSGSVSRFDKVSKLLRMLELTEKVYFKIENKKITVYQNHN